MPQLTIALFGYCEHEVELFVCIAQFACQRRKTLPALDGLCNRRSNRFDASKETRQKTLDPSGTPNILTTTDRLLKLLLSLLDHLPAIPLLHQLHRAFPEPVLHPLRPSLDRHGDVPSSARQHDVSAPARVNRLDNLLRHRLGIQSVVDERIALAEALEELRAREPLADDDGPDLWRIVRGRQLCAETLVEGQRRRLGRGIIDHVGSRHVRGRTGDGHNHAVVRLDHVRQELLRQEVVRDAVHVERETDVAFCALEERFPARDAGVVDEDGWVAQLGFDGIAGFDDGGARGQVAFEVFDGGRSYSIGMSKNRTKIVRSF